MNMNFQHVQNISNGIATVLIYDEIGESFDPHSGTYSGISGKKMANEIQMLNEFPEIKQINVRINSSGGSVLDGYSIFSALKNSQKPVHTFIDGLGASIAGIIFQAGQKRHIVDFGRLMIHDPSIANGSMYLNEKQKRMLDSFRNSLMTILKNNSKMDSESLDQIMANETWLDPNESIKNGFADEIIETGRVYDSIMEPDQIMAISNKYKFYKQNQTQMENLKNHLGIDLDSNETQIIDVVKSIQNDLDSAKTEIETKSSEIETLNENVSTLTTANDTLKTENEKHVETIANMIVDNAISKGLFDETQKSDLINQCKNDIDGFKSIIKALKPVPAKITNVINNDSKNDVPSLRELEKTNPGEVQRLINDEPETYKMMYVKQYGVEPKM